MIGNKRSYLLAALLFFSTGSSAFAVLVDPHTLIPGQTVSPVPDGGSGSDFIFSNHGTTTAFSFDGVVGTLTEHINRFDASPGDPAHPYGSDLHFAYVISLTTGTIAKLIVDGYSGFDTAVKQCTGSGCSNPGAGGVKTNSASRSADGDEITFTFSNLIGGEHTGNLQIFTDATYYHDPFATLYDSNGASYSLDVSGPAVAPSVPEPSTWAMMILGFAAVGFMAHRRTAKPVLMAA